MRLIFFFNEYIGIYNLMDIFLKVMIYFKSRVTVRFCVWGLFIVIGKLKKIIIIL